MRTQVTQMMKPLLAACLFIAALTSNMHAQNITSAPPDKSVVYFVRAWAGGLLVNFNFYDGEKFIGKFNASKYMRYECEPGSHVFWARAENRDFLEAELDAGKVYIINANPRVGAVKTAVQLMPFDSDRKMTKKKALKLLAKKGPVSFTTEELELETFNSKEIITRGLAKYKEDKKNNIPIVKLERTMFYSLQ